MIKTRDWIDVNERSKNYTCQILRLRQYYFIFFQKINFKANCTWSSWKESDCIGTCSPQAFRIRSRSIIKEAKDGGHCEGENREIESCNLDDCTTCKILLFRHITFHNHYLD